MTSVDIVKQNDVTGSALEDVNVMTEKSGGQVGVSDGVTVSHRTKKRTVYHKSV